jgi:transposase
VACQTPARQLVFQAYVRAGPEHTARLQRLAQELHDQVNAWRLQPGADALQALRGVPCTAAATLAAELGDLTRCDHPREPMTCLGPIPAASSTGERRRQGSLTTAGHRPARRVMVEGAWAPRHPADVSRHLPLRLATRPRVIQDSSWNAQVRRCTRYRRLIARGKHAHQVVVASARELMGFMGAMAKEVSVTS